MQKKEITFADVISAVRNQLLEKANHIVDVPTPFDLMWWPANPWSPGLQSFPAQLNSDYGISSGPKQINDEFFAEVNAIHECLDKLGYAPEVARWQKTENQDGRKMYSSLNQRAQALSVWEEIAFPIRRRGDIVFRIFAPHDVFGSPIVEAMPVDEFIQGVSSQTARDKWELSRSQKHLKQWKIFAGVIAAAFLIALLEIFH